MGTQRAKEYQCQAPPVSERPAAAAIAVEAEARRTVPPHCGNRRSATRPTDEQITTLAPATIIWLDR